MSMVVSGRCSMLCGFKVAMTMTMAVGVAASLENHDCTAGGLGKQLGSGVAQVAHDTRHTAATAQQRKHSRSGRDSDSEEENIFEFPQ